MDFQKRTQTGEKIRPKYELFPKSNEFYATFAKEKHGFLVKDETWALPDGLKMSIHHLLFSISAG
jgi:hypothetical protein